MAHNFQNSTLSLTLPISCQICLGKVRQPVICANNHVFCSTCMQIWLKKASQCPTCRVPITAQNPCREIIGGTNEGEHADSPSVKKRLRKSRGELLLREYEDEIDGLLKDNEELKAKNESLESQLDPCNITVAQREDKSVDPGMLEEWTSRLRAATDLYSKVKQDVEKLKEANKTLRSQNIDLVQENMQLKAEVSSRSPQKFGRYTVAALEAKIHQYERDVDHLKKALERSDQYIEDLESSQATDPERRRAPAQPSGALPCTATSGDPGDEADSLPEHQTIKMMTRSLSDTERASICTNPEQECPTLPVISGFLPGRRAFREALNVRQKDEDMDSASSDLFLPSTPSSAFRSLTLKSPGLRGEKKVAFKSISYLRRLSFEDCVGPGSNSCGAATFPGDTEVEPSESVYWGAWTNAKPSDQAPCPGQSTDGDELLPGPGERSPAVEAASGAVGPEDSDSLQMASEASMDVAYLNKISELDSMMLDGESSSSRGSLLSSLASPPPVDFDLTLAPQLEDVQPHGRCGSEGPALGRASAGGSSSPSTVGGAARRLACGGNPEASQSEELLFDLLFETKAGTSGSPGGDHHDVEQQASPSLLPPSSPSSSGGTGKPGNTSRDKQTVTTGHPTKRSHSPFSNSSPTKLSKLM
ncbi:ORC ubiquitin ligase 1 [Aplochiton taeniatus]